MNRDFILYLIGSEAKSLADVIRLDDEFHVTLRHFPTPAEFLHDADLNRAGCVILSIAEDRALDNRLVSLVPSTSPISLLYVTAPTETRKIVSTMLRGAVDVLELPADHDRITTAVRQALAKSGVRYEQISQLNVAAGKISDLTAGEREVLDLMAAGMPNKKVAPALGIALRTVEARRKRIFSKLGTRSLLKIAHLLHCVDGGNAQVKAPAGLTRVAVDSTAVSRTTAVPHMNLNPAQSLTHEMPSV